MNGIKIIFQSFFVTFLINLKVKNNANFK